VRVIGTAGHVDHGKSTLVQALTGINPDRLKEEQEREMTIDLGFAWLTLPSGERVGIVDVPGHQDFIKNMLAGVGGIDAALFVIAADEGVMPQTREHLAILDLLKVAGGVVALTKADLAGDSGVEPAEWLELVAADVAELLSGTALAGAPIVPVSARSGEGLAELLRELDGVLTAVPVRRDLNQPRLPIDRVFTIAGFGTVVTGTLSDGTLQVGQEVEIVAAGRRRAAPYKARIRGLQTHKEKVETALPGSRVAVNLTGVSTADLERGDVVTGPGWLRPTTLLDARLRYLADAPRPLRHNLEVGFFSGAAEVTAHVRLLDAETLAPGDAGWVQLRLREPVPVVKGDRFIIRQPSPSLTLGGGVIIDPFPGRRHRRFRPEVISRLETMAHGTPEELLLETLEKQGPQEARELIKSSNLPAGQAVAAMERLLAGGQLLTPGRDSAITLESGGIYLFSRSQWSSLAQRLTDTLAAYHRQYPLRSAMPREELKSRLRLPARLFNELLTLAAQEGQAVELERGVRLPTHQVSFDPQTRQQIERLMTRLARDRYAPPGSSELEAEIGPEVLNALLASGELLRLGELLFLPDAYDEMVEKVIKAIKERGSITVAQVRDMFGTSRRYALALLEHLDEQKITIRRGDERVLRSERLPER
jgi:selenocysteine-specific elongation factor